MTLLSKKIKRKQRLDWELYELKKKNLRNLSLTPAQYQEAIRKIARECGV